MTIRAPPVVPALLAALGALSLGWALYVKYTKNSSDEAKEADDESKKKRPPSGKTSPEHAKRPKTAGSATNGTKGLQRMHEADPEKLAKHYAKIAFKFENEGLNIKAVEDARKYYSIKNKKAEPLDYLDFKTPLARGAVRLGVFRLGKKEAGGLADSLAKASKEIAQVFPDGSIFHFNDKEHYHLTVQMISHPSNPRPDSGVAGGGFKSDEIASTIPAPSPTVLHKETATYKKIASSQKAPELKVHSVVFADSGTLLLLLTDATGEVLNIRQALGQALPGAVENQPSILHITLARLLSSEELGEQKRDKIVTLCRKWTDELRGKTLRPDALWHVQENTFTHIDDKSSQKFPFKK